MSNLIAATKSFKYGEHEVILETNKIARQATASVKVTMGETVVLVALVASKEGDPTKNFLPLTIFSSPLILILVNKKIFKQQEVQ